MKHCTLVFCLLLISPIKFNVGLESNKQNRYYNTNTDFLLHEGGNYPNSAKKDAISSQSQSTITPQNSQALNNGKRDYVAEFPALGKPSTPKTSTTASTAGQNSGKRDYVASFPSLPNPSTLKPASTNAWNRQNPLITTSGGNSKRDYVAPNHTTQKPATPVGSKVKDLVNFYDGKSNGQNNPQKPPSYSSILQGTTNKINSGLTSTTTGFAATTPKPSLPTKPLSFSNVVSGPKSPVPNTPTPNQKPTTKVPNVPSVKPTQPVLPSSIVNSNPAVLTIFTNPSQVGTGNPNDSELQALSEELLRKDVNNAAKYITINYQERTTGQSKDDKAPRPLLTISPQVWNIPTIQAFVPLLDNYERDTLVNEYVTPQERNEENVFMDAIMSTTVIRHLMNYLKTKGLVSPDPKQQRDFLKQLWFNLYSRGKGKISSSGFEHVFVSELKNGQVSGLHNWIYFSKEESANRLNYLGYLKYVDLNDKGAVLKLHFNQQGVDKPVDSMFIGTSPELEIALYTLCFLTRVDTECKLKLANKDIEIVTHKFRYRSKDYIGSAYPQIPSNWN